MAATLAQLLSELTPEQAFQILLAVFQSEDFPINAWQVGGTERTRALAFSTAISDISGKMIPTIAAGGFVDYADANWLPLLSHELYNVDQNLATFTQGNIVATCTAGVGPYNFQPGQLIAVFQASGNRYKNVNAGTIATNTTTTILFGAEFAGAKYNDPSNSAGLTLSTSLPGVTLTNPANTYSAIQHAGSGTGTLTLGGSPALPHQVLVTITSTGASGVASWEYSIDGAPNVSAGAVATLTNVGGTGINITLTNGGSGTSFVVGDTYLFSTPGSWITVQGSDIESQVSLANRDRERWSTLSPIPITDLYALLATSTPTVGSQVVQVIVQPDPVINDKLNIVVAGPAGPLPGAAITSIQNYINPRSPLGVLPVVISPTIQNITIAGAVIIDVGAQASAPGDIQTALLNYIDTLGINGTVRISAIIDRVMNVSGVVDFSGVTINGVAANLVLGSAITFVVASLTIPLSLSYVIV